MQKVLEDERIEVKKDIKRLSKKEYIKKGMSKDEASKKAYRIIVSKEETNYEIQTFKSFVEILNKNADQGDYVDDFVDSDAPQFKGKSKKKRVAMAVAAYKSKNEDDNGS